MFYIHTTPFLLEGIFSLTFGNTIIEEGEYNGI